MNGRVIHQMFVPIATGYVQREDSAFGEHVTALSIGDLSLDTSKP